MAENPFTSMGDEELSAIRKKEQDEADAKEKARLKRVAQRETAMNDPKKIVKRKSYQQYKDLLAVVRRGNVAETMYSIHDLLNSYWAFGSESAAGYARHSLNFLLKQEGLVEKISEAENPFAPMGQEEQNVINKKAEELRKQQAEQAEEWVRIAKAELEAVIGGEVEIEDEMSDRFACRAVGDHPGSDESEWLVVSSEDSARAIAIDRVAEDLANDPAMFNQEWLAQFVSMSNTDRRIISGEEADSYVEGLDDADAIVEAGLETEYSEAEEAEDQEKMDELIDQARERIQEEVYDKIYDALSDPIQYFVRDHGMYSETELLKANFITIDTDEAAESAVDEDGVAHFLDHYDGAEIELPSGAVAYGTN